MSSLDKIFDFFEKDEKMSDLENDDYITTSKYDIEDDDIDDFEE